MGDFSLFGMIADIMLLFIYIMTSFGCYSQLKSKHMPEKPSKGERSAARHGAILWPIFFGEVLALQIAKMVRNWRDQ